MSWSGLKISKKLIVAFACVLVVLAGLTAIVVRSLSNMESAVSWNDHTYDVLTRGSEALSGMVNQETGLRGFLIDGNEAFLAPYVEGRKQFLENWEAAKRLTADNPAQQARLDKIRAFADDWRDKIAEVEIQLMRQPDSREKARGIEASGAGKAAMDSLRAVMADFDHAERSLLAIRSQSLATASSTAGVAMVGGSLLATILAVTMGWLLNASIARPIARMTIAMKSLAGGETSIAIPAIGRRDEVGDMAAALQTFKDNAVALNASQAEQQRLSAASDIERERNEKTRAETARQLSHVVSSLAAALQNLADGDLVSRVEEPFVSEYEPLRIDFNRAVDKLQASMRTVAECTADIRSGSRDVGTAADDLSRRTEQQAANLEETAAALEQITLTVKKTSEGAIHARDVVSRAKEDATQSETIVRHAVGSMEGIEKSAAQISNIISVIDEIAFQTNLLALNAGVEAARAGEAGRGFAVVASEVRALAQRSAEAAREIKNLIATSNAEVERGVDFVGQAGRALESILRQIGEINSVVSEIAASAQEQARGLQEVNTAVKQMDQVTQQNAAMVEETTAASHGLRGKSEELEGLISQFQLNQGGRKAASSERAVSPATQPSKIQQKFVSALKTIGGRGAAKKPRPSEDGWDEF